MTPRVDPIFFNRQPEHLRDFSELVQDLHIDRAVHQLYVGACSFQMGRLRYQRELLSKNVNRRKMSPSIKGDQHV